MHCRVHSSVVRAADCRSAGPWLKSGCALHGGRGHSAPDPSGEHNHRGPWLKPGRAPFIVEATTQGLTRVETATIEAGHRSRSRPPR